MEQLNINPENYTELLFSSKNIPDDSQVSFIIEGVDEFSLICKAVRDDESIRVFIPRILNLFRGGSYRARLEVVFEDRRYIPFETSVRIPKSQRIDESMNFVVDLVSLRESQPKINHIQRFDDWR